MILCFVAPSGVPSNVRVLAMTSRTANVSWNAIDCGEENGPNFHYEVEFQRMDGGDSRVVEVNGIVDSSVNDELSTVVGQLRPFTTYSIQVRATNDEGSADYTSAVMIQTNQDSMLFN